MLEREEEYLVFGLAGREGMAAVEAEARRLGRPLPPPQEPTSPTTLHLRPMLAMYGLLTGFAETNPNAVFHHIVGLYGPPCPQCRKPLRTSNARFCAACGFGMKEMAADTRPLVKRHSNLFPPASDIA